MTTTTAVDSPNLQDRSPRTIGLHSNKENDSGVQLFPPSENIRRGSFPLESLREAEYNSSNNANHNKGHGEEIQKKRLAKSYSFNEGMKQPTICLDGIPLGSLTAQEAAKSFWNMDMLHQRLQKITECAAQETSSLGSSVESVDLQTPEDIEETITMKIDTEKTIPQSEPSSPRLKPQVMYARSHSAGKRLTPNLLNTKSKPAVLTPPFLSPGTTRKRRVGHCPTSHPNFVVMGRKMNLSPKASDSSLSDDGYFDF